MKVFAGRLKEARKNNGLTTARLGELLAVGANTVSRWETGKREPDLETVARLAEILHTTVAYLMGETDDPSPETGGKKIDQGMDMSAIEPLGNLVWVPVIRPEITLEAGKGADYTYSQLEWEMTDRIPLFDGELSAYYSESSLLAMHVEGDSMEPQIHDGDLVVFAKTQDWVSGNIMVVCLDGKLLVKGVISNGPANPPVLRSLNKAYEDIHVRRDSYFSIVGRVVRIIRVTKPKPVI